MLSRRRRGGRWSSTGSLVTLTRRSICSVLGGSISLNWVLETVTTQDLGLRRRRATLFPYLACRSVTDGYAGLKAERAEVKTVLQVRNAAGASSH
jgi:hypothetical protein